jgi:hypothetical protein
VFERRGGKLHKNNEIEKVGGSFFSMTKLINFYVNPSIRKLQ